MILRKLCYDRISIYFFWYGIILALLATATNLHAQFPSSDNRPSFASSTHSEASLQRRYELVKARDQLRRAFIQKNYEQVLLISDSIRQEFPGYASDTFYVVAAKMRINELAQIAENGRPYPSLNDLPTEAIDFSKAPSLGLTPDLERILEQDNNNQKDIPHIDPIPNNTPSNGNTESDGNPLNGIDIAAVPIITPVPMVTPDFNTIGDPDSNSENSVHQGTIPPEFTVRGNPTDPNNDMGRPTDGTSEKLIATASTPVPINSALNTPSAAANSGKRSIEAFGFKMPQQIGYILLGIIVAVIIIVVILQFLGRRREDRNLEEALATHGGTLSGTNSNILIDDDEEILEGYPQELDEHSGSTQIDAFEEDSNPMAREAMPQPTRSNTAIAEAPETPVSYEEKQITDDDFDALFASHNDVDPNENTGMEDGFASSEDIPTTDFGQIDIPEMDFQDISINESDTTYSLNVNDEQDSRDPEIVLNDEIDVGSPSVWNELDTSSVEEDNDIISFDEPDLISSADEISDVDMGSDTHTSFEERAMDSTSGMSDSEIQNQFDDELPSSDMNVREFHADETVDVNITGATDALISEELEFEEPELRQTQDQISPDIEHGEDTLVSQPQEDALEQPEYAETNDMMSLDNIKSPEVDLLSDSILDQDSPEVADTQGIDDLHGMETLVVDPPDFENEPAPAPEPKQSAIQNLIQSNSKHQAPSGKSPIVNTGDSLFDRELRQGEEAYSNGDWDRAVHHLSIAAALKPDNKAIREKLRDSRAQRKNE